MIIQYSALFMCYEDSTDARPHKSQWIFCNGFFSILFFKPKGALQSFFIWHLTQTVGFLFQKVILIHLFLSKTSKNIEFGCPSLACQTSLRLLLLVYIVVSISRLLSSKAKISPILDSSLVQLLPYSFVLYIKSWFIKLNCTWIFLS